jgi:hypothetical protein
LRLRYVVDTNALRQKHKMIYIYKKGFKLFGLGARVWWKECVSHTAMMLVAKTACDGPSLPVIYAGRLQGAVGGRMPPQADQAQWTAVPTKVGDSLLQAHAVVSHRCGGDELTHTHQVQCLCTVSADPGRELSVRCSSVDQDDHETLYWPGPCRAAGTICFVSPTLPAATWLSPW